MAQVPVTQFYNTRKHQRNVIKDLDFEKPQIDVLKSEVHRQKKVEKVAKDSNLSEKATLSEKICGSKELSIETKPISKSKAVLKKATTRKGTKSSKKVTSKKADVGQTIVTSFYSSVDTKCAETVANSSKQLEKKTVVASKCKLVSEKTEKNFVTSLEHSSVEKEVSTSNSDILNEAVKDSTQEIKETTYETKGLQSPKRKIPIPVELTPSKKKQYLQKNNDSSAVTSSPQKKMDSVCRKLDMGVALSPSKIHTPFHSPVKNQAPSPRKMLSPEQTINAVIDQSRAKLMLSPKLNELRKSLDSFSRKTSMIKQMQSNPYKITSVVSPTKTKSNMSVLPAIPAHERFSYLTAPQPTLSLPLKYKILSEMFRSTDTVVSMLHNRKELITFEKIQDGVQKMMKRNFSKSHFSQIVTVLPFAYKLAIEKCGVMNKKVDNKDYQLVISPILSSKETNKKSKSTAFEPMNPQCLSDRINKFNEALFKITKDHHLAFLERIKFSVPNEEIKQWHPKFPLDSVPDIQQSSLPEPPDNKVYTAKDVLNKVRGTLNSKVSKALQSVAEESKKDITLELKDVSNSKPDSNKALKGICSDLLAKIRARESAKLLETMTRTPDETKRQAMLQRLPKIVNILWHYFIAERKLAVPVDVAVEKVIHSFNSLVTADDVKDHLKLLSETFPGWLTFIEIRKGVFIQIDKKRNINEMLDKFQY